MTPRHGDEPSPLPYHLRPESELAAGPDWVGALYLAGYQTPATPIPGPADSPGRSVQAQQPAAPAVALARSGGAAGPQTPADPAHGRTDPRPPSLGHGAADGHCDQWAGTAGQQPAPRADDDLHARGAGNQPVPGRDTAAAGAVSAGVAGAVEAPAEAVTAPARHTRRDILPARTLRLTRRATQLLRVARHITGLVLAGALFACACYVAGLLIGLAWLLYS